MGLQRILAASPPRPPPISTLNRNEAIRHTQDILPQFTFSLSISRWNTGPAVVCSRCRRYLADEDAQAAILSGSSALGVILLYLGSHWVVHIILSPLFADLVYNHGFSFHVFSVYLLPPQWRIPLFRTVTLSSPKKNKQCRDPTLSTLGR